MDWGPVFSGAIGAVSTATVAIFGYRHARSMATDRHNQDRDQSLDERRQQRLSLAYVEVLQLVREIEYWCMSVAPWIDTNPPRPVPDLPPVKEQARVDALIDAFASEEVRALWTPWREIVGKISGAVMMIDQNRQYRDGGDYAIEASRSLEDTLRPAEQRAREALAERIGVELGHRLPSTGTDLDTPTSE
jgi:hypothetical protein